MHMEHVSAEPIAIESRQRPTHKRNPSLRDNDVASDSVHTDLPHIATLIVDGEITVGLLNPVGCVAVALLSLPDRRSLNGGQAG